MVELTTMGGLNYGNTSFNYIFEYCFCTLFKPRNTAHTDKKLGIINLNTEVYEVYYEN